MYQPMRLETISTFWKSRGQPQIGKNRIKKRNCCSNASSDDHTHKRTLVRFPQTSRDQIIVYGAILANSLVLARIYSQNHFLRTRYKSRIENGFILTWTEFAKHPGRFTLHLPTCNFHIFQVCVPMSIFLLSHQCTLTNKKLTN